jgi:hypothetical protein
MEQMRKVANCAVLCSSRQVQPLFKTVAGELFFGKCEEILKARKKRLAGKVQLILTSPLLFDCFSEIRAASPNSRTA